MALAATRCFDSLISCSSVRCSSCGIAASAPTCICILTCFCLATARSLPDAEGSDLEQLEEAAREQGRPLDLHLAARHPSERSPAAPVCRSRQPGEHRRRGELDDVGEGTLDDQVGG